MARTIAQKTNAVGFPKPGELIGITGAHELEAQDRIIMNLLYQHAHGSDLIKNIGAEWEVPMQSLRSSLHESNDRIRASLRRLLRIVVTVPVLSSDNNEPRIIETHLFDFFNLPANEQAANSTVRFGLPKMLQPLIAGSEHWGRIKAETVLAMTSKYAIALYEAVQVRCNKRVPYEKFTLEQFRDLMGVPPGKLLLGRDLERRAIEPAVLEVNGLSDYKVEIELIRKHDRAPITEVRIAWSRKGGDEYRALLAEEKQPKQGRLARLRAAAEKAPARKKLVLS